jgi:hypothetical protein
LIAPFWKTDCVRNIINSINKTPTSPTIYAEEKPGNNPFGIDLVGDSSIVPTVELQKWEPGGESTIGGGS